MSTWFIILLAAIVVGAITVLLFFAIFDDDDVSFYKPKHRRGEYINDQTAVIVHSIKETEDSAKAYQLFAEYILSNHRLFLSFVSARIRSIQEAYAAQDYARLREEIAKTKEMKVELKDQVQTQETCLQSIDTAYYIETAVWINIANNTRFDVNRNLRRLAEVCIHYDESYDCPFPSEYVELIDTMIDDICNFCSEAISLINSGDDEGMRDIRTRITAVMTDSYDNTSRLYNLIHDGRNTLDEDRATALRYVLNAFQECYCIVYGLRRIVLCNRSIIASLHNY
ncbi:MAG: hypothetical protein NC095_08790 [Muribaculum sp.]|nr:hypothetical protein [Muribaculum sp.]